MNTARLLAVLAVLAVLSVAPAALGGEPAARPNRLTMGIHLGIGTASLDSAINGDLRDNFARANPELAVGGAPDSSTLYSAGVSLRYYLPFHVLIEAGFDTLYNHSSTEWSQSDGFGGTLEDHNLMMEIPILVGGYGVFKERTYLWGAIGPAFGFFDRAWWDINPGTSVDPGEVTDFKADGSVGLHLAGGATFVASDTLGLELQLRYRSMRSGPLRDTASDPNIIKSGRLRGDGSTDDYFIDFSGISVVLGLNGIVR